MKSGIVVRVALVGFAATVAWAGDPEGPNHPPIPVGDATSVAKRRGPSSRMPAVCQPDLSASAVVTTRPCPNAPSVLCACVRPILSA